MLLIALLLAASLLTPARPAQAAVLGRRTILGKIFRMTPVGRVIKTAEDRSDAYRSANAWLRDQQESAKARNAALQRGLTSREIDLRAYVHARETQIRHDQQYEDVAQRMKAIAHDNFNRALGQQALEHLMPRLARSELFGKTVGEMKATLETGRKLLEEGVLDIQALANKAYPDFMRHGRGEVQQALKKLEESGLKGGPIDEIKSKLQILESALGDLERRVPELVKPDEVKQLQEEAKGAAKTLGELGNKIDAGVARLADKNTTYFAQRSAAKDAQIAAKTKEFAADASLVSRAVGESKARRALGPRLEEALARARLERSDPLYNRVRQRALNLVDPGKAEELSDGELDAYVAIALREITEEAAQPRIYGLAVLDGSTANLTPRYPPSFGFVKWNAFFEEMTGRRYEQENYSCDIFYPFPSVDDITIMLYLDLDTDEIQSGYWSGTASAQNPYYGVGVAVGAFSGTLSRGTVMAYGQDEGKGFAFEGQGQTRIEVSAAGWCQEYADGKWSEEPVEGSRTVRINTHIGGKWKAGAGELLIDGRDENNNMGIRIVIQDPPFVILALDK
jgi:hypothetical protein